MASRPSPWWSSWNITNVFLPRTNQVGEPCDGRSVTSGSARQSSRTRSSSARTSRQSATGGYPAWPKMAAPPTEHEILDVNRRYHDVAAETYDSKWGISFGPIGHQQVL